MLRRSAALVSIAALLATGSGAAGAHSLQPLRARTAVVEDPRPLARPGAVPSRGAA